MKKRVFFLGTILISIFITVNVHASGNVKLSMSCPSSAKPNTEIKCIVYGTRTGSQIESVEEINATPTGALTKSDYLIDYSIIHTGNPRNIGTITIKTGNTGTGKVELVFDMIHFVDGTFQNNVKISKTISVTSNGETSVNNPRVSGSTTNNAQTTNNSDTYLKDIKLSRGILTPSFSKNVYNYTVTVDPKVDKISIDGIKNDQNQKIEGEVINHNLKYGKNNFALSVTNGNSSKRTYQIVINRQDNRDTNTNLSSLLLNEGTINFSPTTYEYEAKVLNEITEANIIATPEKQTSTVKIEGEKNLKEGENIITVTVKSEKGNEKKYRIRLTRLKKGETLGDNANIKKITIKGYNLNFDYDKQEYKLVIKREKQLDIKVTMDDPSASFKIMGNNDLKDGSIIQIITTSNDGKNSNNYSIEITKPDYTIYSIIAIAITSLIILIPLIIYFKYVKPKKVEVDVNGYKINKDDENVPYRKTIVLEPNEKNTITPEYNNQLPNNINNNQISQPQPVINIEEANNQNELNNITPNISSSQCPYCQRELLGNPSICPYCNSKLY